MSLMEVLKEEGIDENDKEKIAQLQKFYQHGYFQGSMDKNPNYDYSLKYRSVIERLLKLFELSVSPLGLEQLEICLDNLDKFRRENLI